MEPASKKGLGIIAGIVALVGVFAVSSAGMKKDSVAAGTPNTPAPNPSPADTGGTSGVASQTQNTRYYSDDGSENENESEGEDGAVATNPAPAPVPAPAPKKISAAYKDGTYSATGSYMSPGGYDQLGVTLTIKGDIVTSASVTNMAGDRTSSRYQNAFISGYQQYVIGQDISTLSLSRVSGASLTPEGFNDAVNQIKAQAKA